MASHILCDCGPLATLRFRLLSCHCMKPVTLKTSLSARYCMLFTVRYCWTNELKDYAKDFNGQNAWLTAVPTLPYSVLLFCFRYWCVFSSLLRTKLSHCITTIYVSAVILVLSISVRCSCWFLTPCTVQFLYILYAFFFFLYCQYNK